MVGVALFSGMAAAAPGAVPLQMCEMPLLGDFASWALPLLRQLMIWGGVAAAGYGLVFAPAQGGRAAPRQYVLGGALVFAVGVLWVSIVVYAGTEVLGGDAALINAATCGMDTGAGA
jgi:hypothetical protein